MELWTVERLKSALETALEGEVALSLEDHVLVARFEEQGGVTVSLTVEGDQMLASTLLWKRSEESDPRAFEEKALRMHKFLPLSTIGITTLGGEDWYELFGALSAGSTLDNVVLELTFLVQNALDLAEARGEADAA